MKTKQKKIKTEDLLQSSLREQQFYRIQCEYLLSALYEIKTFSGELEKRVIDNLVERHELDKMIHAKLIFE